MAASVPEADLNQLQYSLDFYLAFCREGKSEDGLRRAKAWFVQAMKDWFLQGYHLGVAEGMYLKEREKVNGQAAQADLP